MTFEQLDYFIAVVESDTFFDAAEALHITQSTLSKQIMKLEKELDLQLLDRSRRSASLTEAGQLFYEEALHLSQEGRRAILRVQKSGKTSGKRLRIGTLPILSQYQLTAIVKDFSDQHPYISVSLEEVEEHDLLNGFAQNKYDLIIVRSNMTDAKKHIFYSLAEDRLVAILPQSHRLAKSDSVTIHDIAREKFILMHPYTSIYQFCMELFGQSGIAPDLIRTARMESIISAVAVHEGISLLPEENFKLFHYGNIVSIPIAPTQKLAIGMARKKEQDLSEAVSGFIQYAENYKHGKFNL